VNDGPRSLFRLRSVNSVPGEISYRQQKLLVNVKAVGWFSSPAFHRRTSRGPEEINYSPPGK